jgi:hypothetical protein
LIFRGFDRLGKKESLPDVNRSKLRNREAFNGRQEKFNPNKLGMQDPLNWVELVSPIKAYSGVRRKPF